jgi:peptide subunit release factor 1 (eRF1)
MPVKPQPYIAKCPKCGYEKVVRHESDAISSFPMCPKCHIALKRTENGSWLSKLKLALNLK